MPLPKVSTPIFELELPSNGKVVQYRPFLVKEEKIMIIANESNDPKQVTTAVRQVLENCILSIDGNKKPSIENLSTFDLEYLFLNMYRRSVDDVFELTLVCPDDEVTQVKVKIDVNDIKVKKNKDHQDTFNIDDDIVIKMKYPTFKQFVDSNFDYSSLEDNNLNLNQVDQSFKLIVSCIDTITSKDGTCYSANDVEKSELIEWVETLNQNTFQKINSFFETMPKLSHEVKFKNKVTKKDCTLVLEGLSDFFD